MHILIPIIAGAAYKAGCKLWQDHQRKTTRASSVVAQPKWTSAIECSHTPEQACALIGRFLSENGAELNHRTESVSLYSRGDPSITRLPTDCNAKWHEIPAWIGFTHGRIGDSGNTLIDLDFRPFSSTSFSERAAQQFEQLARKEFDRIIEFLNTAQEPADHSSHEPGNALVAELESLGLAIGATWEQVQAAYRELSRKYHPDTLGRDIDSHLVELAQARFSEIASAYKRLRDRDDLRGA
jgi:hypothetical protein